VKTCSDNCAVCDYQSCGGSIVPLEEGLKLIVRVTVLWMLVKVAVLWKCDGTHLDRLAPYQGDAFPLPGTKQPPVSLKTSQG
jgi:hypothetical protein